MAVNFPGSIDTTSTLYSPFNEYKWKSRLKYAITEGETVLTLTDLSNIISELANNFIGIDNEIMFVQSIDNSGAEKKITVLRGQGGSVAAIHSAGVEVIQTYVAEYHKKLVEAIIAVETYAKSGDMPLDNLTQITTRNHNDLQNLNAPSAHPSASIDNTSTAYGRGLATTDNTVQKIADRVNTNGTSQFKTDKSKCNLLLDFKDGLTDKTRGVNPVGYELANRWSNNFINDSTSEASATNISCTLKQFDGDEGKFGSGVAVEESRTNLLLQSEDLTNAAWTKQECTVVLDKIENGQKIFKVTATGTNCRLLQPIIITAGQTYTISAKACIGNVVNPSSFLLSTAFGVVDILNTQTKKLIMLSGSKTISSQPDSFGFALYPVTAGDTFYISQPQLEAGSFPTSYIATGATAVTRPAGKLSYDKSELNGSNIYSISFWFNPDYDYNDSGEIIYPKGILNIGTKHWLTYHNVLKGFLFYTDNTSGICRSNAYSSNTDFKNNHHIILIQDGSTAYMVIDNIKYQVTGTAVSLTSSLINLGYGGGNFPANGTISNFAIFNYALSDAEISQIYNSGLEGKPVTCANEVESGQTPYTLRDTLITTLQNSWVWDTSVTNQPLITKHGDRIFLNGIISKSGSVNADEVLFTLPVGMRPQIPDTYFRSFTVSSRDSGAPSARIIRVYGNGNVTAMLSGGTIVNPMLSLDNISFRNGK